MGDLVETAEARKSRDEMVKEAIRKTFEKKPEDMDLKEYLMYLRRRYRQRMDYIGFALRRW